MHIFSHFNISEMGVCHTIDHFKKYIVPQSNWQRFGFSFSPERMQYSEFKK